MYSPSVAVKFARSSSAIHSIKRGSSTFIGIVKAPNPSSCPSKLDPSLRSDSRFKGMLHSSHLLVAGDGSQIFNISDQFQRCHYFINQNQPFDNFTHRLI